MTASPRSAAAVLLLAGVACAQSGESAAQGTGASSVPPALTTRKAGRPAVESPVFSNAVVNDVLFDLAEGMEAHDQRRLLSAFSPAMSGYRSFAGQVAAWFDHNRSFRVYYNIRQVSAGTGKEAARGIALVDFEYEAAPVSSDVPPERRREQLRLVMERSAKGWKIVEFSPRGFFS